MRSVDSDPIVRLQDEWRHELPDLDTHAMATVARLNRTRAMVMREIETELVAAGSSLADFDVLATLRRQGPPYRMKPSTLARTIMLSASGVTSRIDHLERAGLVERVHDPTNRRTAPVVLTERGIAEAERLARGRGEIEERIMSSLTARQRQTLDASLATLATRIESGRSSGSESD